MSVICITYHNQFYHTEIVKIPKVRSLCASEAAMPGKLDTSEKMGKERKDCIFETKTRVENLQRRKERKTGELSLISRRKKN